MLRPDRAHSGSRPRIEPNEFRWWQAAYWRQIAEIVGPIPVIVWSVETVLIVGIVVLIAMH